MSLEVQGAAWQVGGTSILGGIDLRAADGAITGLLGPNGSGKSSLLRLIAGIRPNVQGPSTTRGRVTWAGDDLLALRPRDRARIVALVEQEVQADVALRVREAVMLGRTPHRRRWAGESPADHAEVERAMSAVGLDGMGDREISTLSGGERQRLHLARALAQQTALLLLDEPTNHLDIHAQIVALDLVHRASRTGTTALVALHDLNLAAAYCDHVVLLDHGRVAAAGNPTDVLVPEIIDPVYGVSTTVLRHPRTGRPVLTFQAEEAPPAPLIDADDDAHAPHAIAARQPSGYASAVP